LSKPKAIRIGLDHRGAFGRSSKLAQAAIISEEGIEVDSEDRRLAGRCFMLGGGSIERA
jgi:hypothetical protein